MDHFAENKLNRWDALLYAIKTSDRYKKWAFGLSMQIEGMRLYLVCFEYLFGMLSLAWTMWKHKVKFRTEIPGQMIVIHYNKNDFPDPSAFAPFMEQKVVRPFRALHRIDPIVLILPFGVTIQGGNLKGFVRSLSTDQRSELQEALYECRVDRDPLASAHTD